MEFNEAESLSLALRRAAGLLDGALGKSQRILSDESYELFRIEIGTLLGNMYDLILEDIWDEFPELSPGENQVSSASSKLESIAALLNQAEKELQEAARNFPSLKTRLLQLKEMIDPLRLPEFALEN